MNIRLDGADRGAKDSEGRRPEKVTFRPKKAKDTNRAQSAGPQVGTSQSVPSAQGSKNSWQLVSRAKRKSNAPRPAKKVKDRGEVLLVKTDEDKYADTLKPLRVAKNPSALGQDVRSVRRTKTGEMILVLKRGAQSSGAAYKKLAQELLGDGAQVRSLDAEVTLQCKQLDKVTNADNVVSTVVEQGGLVRSPPAAEVIQQEQEEKQQEQQQHQQQPEKSGMNYTPHKPKVVAAKVTEFYKGQEPRQETEDQASPKGRRSRTQLEEGWSTVVGQNEKHGKQRKQKEERKGQQKRKRKPSARQTAPKGETVLIKANVTPTYAGLLKKVREEPELRDLGENVQLQSGSVDADPCRRARDRIKACTEAIGSTNRRQVELQQPRRLRLRKVSKGNKRKSENHAKCRRSEKQHETSAIYCFVIGTTIWGSCLGFCVENQVEQ
ncbi:putative uncharacterized protein DDB_G0287113 [Topomyia yanbarensis]|uniref:putative uncharacterized protein DDB_G0287113 n=1 Tax=Topomyia yanbarensis TaxID=2498891 RepID=UPI00273AB66F|nr:putative uncharacterized protein DDB_G0287113 [Topomyia yanbarensis]